MTLKTWKAALIYGLGFMTVRTILGYIIHDKMSREYPLWGVMLTHFIGGTIVSFFMVWIYRRNNPQNGRR